MRRRASRRSALLVVVAMLGAVLALGTGTASAAPSVTVTPSTNLVDGQVVTVEFVADASYPTGTFYGIVPCGNATPGGAPIAAPGEGDCVTDPAFLGTSLQVASNSGTGPAGLGGGITAGQTYSVSLVMKRTGLGTNNSQCLPLSATITTPCTIQVAAADAGGNSYGTPGTAVVSYRPPATLAIDSVTGQAGNQAARAGDTINVSGTNWDANGTLTAELCAPNLTGCEATVTGSVTTGATGDIDPSGLVVDGGATPGARALKLTDGVQTASAPVQILGARTLSLSPAAGGLGTLVTVNGSGFDANATVALSATDGVNGLGAPTITAASATGAVNGTVTITDLATIGIGATQLDGGGIPVAGTEAFAPFGASANTCDGSGCEVVQTVNLLVTPGVLNITQVDNQVTMGSVQLDGNQQTSTGSIADITITDARGSLVGWSVTATMTDLTLAGGGSNSTIPAANMTVTTPTCAPASATSGSTTGITAGADAQAFGGQVGLCVADSGEGGGTYAVDSGLSLVVPANVRSGTYTSTLTILLT